MAAQISGSSASLSGGYSSELSRVYGEGLVAGVIGAATIAIWFLILDIFSGRPLYTPTVLGSALFRREQGLVAADGFVPSFEMILMYTWVHGLAFCVLGGVASKMLALAEKKPNLGFGILLLFIIFEFGFIGAAFMFAEPILHALAWPAILAGNLLAASVMGVYFWYRHPELIIQP
jgi:hypothetical protein